MIKERTVVKITPKESRSAEFIQKYDNRRASVTCVNPIAGYSGYEVSVWDLDETINLDTNEVVEVK